jgi:multicomponent Na+:H+ antiporter subunit G
MIEWIASFLLLTGAAFMLVAAVGLVRFPDLLTRMHAAAKAGGLGVGLVVGAVAAAIGDAQVITEAVLVAVFLLLTAPVAAHVIARAAHRSGVPLWSGTRLDELRARGGAPREREPAPGSPPGGAASGAAASASGAPAAAHRE